MVLAVPANLKELDELLRRPEGDRIEWKRSTGELRDAMHTVCAFLNGNGGLVLFGIRPDGRAEGQQVSDQTMRDIAEAFDRFEPPYKTPVERIDVGSGREVLVLRVERSTGAIPFVYDGRAYQRVTSTTRRMSQEEYQELLLDRLHGSRRWENGPAPEVTGKDIDREEVLRMLKYARWAGRLSGPMGRSNVEILTRLGLYEDGHFLRGAVVLFGKKFLPHYPQCELRMARFRGTEKLEFLDQRQLRGPAFKLLDEAELFCERHFPKPARIVPGNWRREEKPLIPVDAMREILVNALIHRDYAVAGGAVSLAVFDDRVEVWSEGRFPKGIDPATLTQAHKSVPRNPLIAEAFHRAGLVERWGTGTARVATMCKAAGIPTPEFQEITGAAVVTFRVSVGTTAPVVGKVESEVESRLESQLESRLESRLKSQPGSLERRVLTCLLKGPLGKRDISACLEQKVVSGQLHKVIRDLLGQRFIEYTLPTKPGSRLQKYRVTAAGRRQVRSTAKRGRGVSRDG
ncbi:MAG: ATP-binding protein [Planctomycetota bacterium]